MKAIIKENCGIMGIPTHEAGAIIDVDNFVGPFGHVSSELLQDSSGCVWPTSLLNLICRNCGKPYPAPTEYIGSARFYCQACRETESSEISEDRTYEGWSLTALQCRGF